jgi:hypothetical protein
MSVITLDVRNFPSNGSDGYTNTTASNGATYSYQYSGGSGHGGDVTFHVGNGHSTFVVQLRSDPRYTFNTITFTNDTYSQLSVQNPHAQTSATIQNQNTQVQTANYKCDVSDSNAGCTVPCDPQIINKST